MTSLPTVVMLLAALSSLVLVGAALLPRSRGGARWSFALGMLGLAAETAASYGLLTLTDDSEGRLLFLRAWAAAGLVSLIPWGFFIVALGSGSGRSWPRPVRYALAAGSIGLLGGAAAVITLPAFQIADVPGPFYAVRLESIGRWAVVLQLLATAAILGGLEACLRTSKSETRWRIKYLVLGLGGIFLMRFFLLSQMLLFHVVLAVYLTTIAAALFLGNLLVAGSLLRERLLLAEVTVSRRVVYRSAVVGVLGAYLLVVGALGWLLSHLGIPEELFWGSLVVFVTAVGLAAILFSENVRWRFKRLVAPQFYRDKYDYREQWTKFTRRLGPLLSEGDIARAVLEAATEAAGAARGVLYLVDPHDGQYHLAGAVEADRAPVALSPQHPLVRRLEGTVGAALVGAAQTQAQVGDGRSLSTQFAEGSAAVALRWRDTITGVLLIGPERTGAEYRAEDLEFLSTVADQAAGAVVSAQLSERLAQAREFEAFHRLTSFVIHDLKNSISALSLLSSNALEHFEDPEFQRDALRTLSRTVERMQSLLARLSAAPEASELRVQPVDLAALALEATRPVDGGGRIHLVKEFAPLAPVPGDPDALLKVLQNLVANAVEAVKGEGTVTVRTHEADGWAVCTVTDTGGGMPPEFIKNGLFVPFRSTKKGGWGIGLYHAKGIVEGHGGRIEVSSTVGRGTCIAVRLPLESSRRGGRAMTPGADR
jgi:putative PEP-CTERM system histidine kinase